MKKLLAILLCIATMLSMVACSKNATGFRNEDTAPKPTDKEKAQIEKYAAAVSALNNYAEDGYLLPYGDGENAVYDNEAFACYYKDIVDAECVEKWRNTKYTDDDTINWNRQEVLNNIVIIEDVLLEQDIVREDELGNTEQYNTYYEYGLDGNLICFVTDTGWDPFLGLEWRVESDVSLIGEARYIYDGNRISKIQYWCDGEIRQTITPTYNADGIKTKDIVKSTSEHYAYSYYYDSKGRLASIKYTDMEDEDVVEWELYNYSYDNEGKIIKRQGGWLYSIYSYNDNFSECTITDLDTDTDDVKSSETITFDKAGRVLTWKRAAIDGMSYYYELLYGDYYVYKPAVQE